MMRLALITLLLVLPAVPAIVLAGAAHEGPATSASAQELGTDDAATLMHVAWSNGQASGGVLRFIVDHTGVRAPVMLAIQSERDEIHIVATLEPGRNVLLEQALGGGTRTATMRTVGLTGQTSFDVSDCPGGTLEVMMRTTTTPGSLALSTSPIRCV